MARGKGRGARERWNGDLAEAGKKLEGDEESDSELEGSDEEIDSEEASGEFHSSDDEGEEEMDSEDERALERVRRAVTGKKSAEDEAAAAERMAKAKRKNAQISSVGKEDEFNVQRNKAAGDELDVQALMDDLDDTGKGTLKKKFERLNKGKKALNVPLPEAVQARVNRAAGYEETTKAVGKWQSIVKKNREAETLVLGDTPRINVTTKGLVQKFEARNDLETEVEAILKESGVDEKTIAGYEDLAFNEVKPEDVIARQKELAKMRSMMFMQEQKNKRIKKIKSKTYHKVLKKQKEKEKEKLMELDPEYAAQERLKAEKARAKERMTMKHKNTSKWIKRALERNDNDPKTRKAIMEQIQLGEKLRQKMEMAHSEDESESDESQDDSESGDHSGKEEGEGVNLESVLWKDEEDDQEKASAPRKGLFSLKFMQKAVEKKKNLQEADAEQLLRELTEEREAKDAMPRDDYEDDDDDDDDDESARENGDYEDKVEKKKAKKKAAKGVVNDPNGGRKVYGPSGKVKSSGDLAKEAEEEAKSAAQKKDSAALKQLKASASQQLREVEMGRGATTAASGAVNVRGATTAPVPREDSPMSDDNDAESLGSDVEEKRNEKEVGEKRKNPWLAGNKTTADGPRSKTAAAREQRKKRDEAVVLGAGETNEDGEEHMGNFQLMSGNGSKAATQEDLIRKAFATNEEEEDFLKEKEDVILEEAPQEKIVVLPGWGTWGGMGVPPPSKKPRFAVEAEGRNKAMLEAHKKKRQDKNLKHVIINEKRNKKADTYTVEQLPYPFTSRAQYEKSLRTPVGKDWNTSGVFSKLTAPEIKVKAGTIVDPIKLTKSQQPKRKPFAG